MNSTYTIRTVTNGNRELEWHLKKVNVHLECRSVYEHQEHDSNARNQIQSHQYRNSSSIFPAELGTFLHCCQVIIHLYLGPNASQLHPLLRFTVTPLVRLQPLLISSSYAMHHKITSYTLSPITGNQAYKLDLNTRIPQHSWQRKNGLSCERSCSPSPHNVTFKVTTGAQYSLIGV